MNRSKPLIGVLALMLGAYEPLFEGIKARQEGYVNNLLDDISSEADYLFYGAACGREEIERFTARFNSEGADGILILLLSYSQGQYLVRAMQNNKLPLALVLVQPDETVGDEFEELDLTVNQGIHGSQDNANCMMRAGIKCSYFAGSRKDGSLNRFVADFGAAACTVKLLKSMKIGIVGKLAGMGDVISDDMSFFRNIGPEFVYDSIGTIYSCCENISKQAIDEQIKKDREAFEIDPNLTYESHAYAVKLYLGIKNYLEINGYSGYTAHFEEFGADGRFLQLPLLAASHLMADGYGYAAEGDATTASLVALSNSLCKNANFSEMYMMDLKRNAILFCHAGEGNWATSNAMPRLIDRCFSEGGLANPPTVIFTPRAGRATVITLTHVSGDKFRMICSVGNITDKADLKKCDMPYFFYEPDSGVKDCVTSWLKNGGTHHEAIVLGDYSNRFELLCSMLGIEFISV